MVDLNAFTLLQAERRRGSDDSVEPAPGAFAIDTCQRRLRLAAAPLVAPPGWSRMQGAAAYRMLLEIACGLRSAIPGETHVFGQIKSAWREFPAEGQDAKGLRSIMQALFADTKRIRAALLQGIGRRSYGRLAEALVNPARGDNILIVGAGEMAREMASSFPGHPLAVWSRREPHDLDRHYLRYHPGAEHDALRWADQAIFCTPPVDALDRSWANAARGEQLKTVLHLGYHRVPQPWAQHTAFRTLHDLFKHKRARGNITSLQLQQAKRACHSAAEARTDSAVPAQQFWASMR